MASTGAAPPITADAVASALASDFKLLLPALGPKAVAVPSGDAVLVITGIPVPTMNGVLLLRPTASNSDVAPLLDMVAASGFPYCVQLRPDSPPSLIDLAKEMGMVESEPEPLMILESPGPALTGAATHGGLTARLLGPEEAGVHAEIAAAGFDAPVEIFQMLATRNLFERPGVRAYLGTADGEPVTTALGITNGDHVGVFNVATPRAHQRLGYGGAITARATLDGFAAGAAFAYLQSSAAGFRVYERLGFRTLETWSIWISSPS